MLHLPFIYQISSPLIFLVSQVPWESFEIGSLADWISGAATLAAVCVALAANRNTQAQLAAVLSSSQRRTAEQITIKILRLNDDLMTLYVYLLHNTRSTHFRAKEGKITYKFLIPPFGRPQLDPPVLTPEEVSALLEAGGLAQVRMFELLARRLTADDKALNDLSLRIAEHDNTFPQDSSVKYTIDGSQEFGDVPEPFRSKLEAQARNLSSISTSLMKTLAEQVRDAVQLADDSRSLLRKIGGKQRIIVPETSEMKMHPDFPKPQKSAT